MTEILYDVIALGNAIVDVIAPADESFITEWGIERNAMNLIDEPRAEALEAARARGIVLEPTRRM